MHLRKAEKPSNPYQQSSSKNLVRLLILIIIGLVGFIVYQQPQASDSIERKNCEEVAKYIEKESSFARQLKEAHEEKIAAEQSRHELELQLRGSKDKHDKSNGGSKDLKEMETIIELVVKKVNTLEKAMQNKAKKEIIEKFGPGPHHVRIEIDFNPEEIPDGTATSFTIEMAPIEFMPYTVNHFLQQVSLGLWNGCSFHRNAGHVVQGGPISNHLNPGAKVRKGFKEADLGSVVFQEYHKDFPHKKYTLGYAGRPGGPDFYVSTVDNTRNHGPGGQQDYAMKSEADPCFAKVIDGFDAVDRMHSLSVQPGDYHRLSHYVAIKSATLLP
eukprot:scaffold1698_cov279-Chaetoceros_neogracile.AAC.13